MSPVIYISALLLGFAGSFHCLGMCGPIALSISGRNANAGNRFLPHLLYFTGKTLTYGLMGLLFGLFGQGLVMAGWQQGLSIAMGVIMLLLVLVSLFKSPWFHQNPATTWLQNKLIPVFGLLFKRQGIPASFSWSAEWTTSLRIGIYRANRCSCHRQCASGWLVYGGFWHWNHACYARLFIIYPAIEL